MSDTEYFYQALAEYRKNTGDIRELLEILDDTATFRAILATANALKLAGENPDNCPNSAIPEQTTDGSKPDESEQERPIKL